MESIAQQDGEPPKTDDSSNGEMTLPPAPPETTTEIVTTEAVPQPDQPPAKKPPYVETPQMKAWRERQYEKDLAAAPANGEVETDDGKYIIKAARKAGLSQKRWNVATFRAYQQLGKFLSVKLTTRLLLTNSFDTLEQSSNAIKFCTAMVENSGLSADLRVKASLAVAAAVKSQTELSQHIVELAEKAEEKEKGGSSSKGKNLPPSLGMEMESKDGTIVRAIANTGRAPE